MARRFESAPEVVEETPEKGPEWAELLHDRYSSKKEKLAASPAEAVGLIDEIEHHTEYLQYESQPVTFEVLESILDDFDHQIKESQYPSEEIEEARGDLKGFISDVISSAKGYYHKILEIEHLNNPIVKNRLEPEAMREKLQQLDHSRRYIHNALIDNLRILGRYCRKTLKERFKIKIDPKKLFEDYRLTDENRREIGEWAYHVTFGQRLKQAHDRLVEITEEQKKTPQQ